MKIMKVKIVLLKIKRLAIFKIKKMKTVIKWTKIIIIIKVIIMKITMKVNRKKIQALKMGLII